MNRAIEMEDNEAWADESVSHSDSASDVNAFSSCRGSCISFGSQGVTSSATSMEESDSWVEVDAMDLDPPDEQCQQNQMREEFQALDLSKRSQSFMLRPPSQPGECCGSEIENEAMLELGADFSEMPSQSMKVLPRVLPGDHKVEDRLLFCSWQGPAFPAHRLDFRASGGLPILDMDATRVFDVLRQEFVRRDQTEHALRLEMMDLALDSWKREGRPGWCLNPQPADLKFTNPPQAAFNYNRSVTDPKPEPAEEMQSCFWQSTAWPYYRLYFPMTQGRFDLNVEQARVFDTQEQLFVLGHEREQVLENHFFSALEDLDKEGHPGWQTDPGWWLSGESQPGRYPNSERGGCLPTLGTNSLRPATDMCQQCHWTTPAYPGFRLDLPYEDGAYVLDLDRIRVYDQDIKGYLNNEKEEAETKQYMLNAALEAWQRRGRPGWKTPFRPPQSQPANPQTKIDTDFYALKMADRDFSKKFFRYWQSPSYSGRRVYFPASQGRPQLEWDKIQVYYIYSRRFAIEGEEEHLSQMVEIAMQDWDKPQHPNWCFGGAPPESKQQGGPVDVPNRQSAKNSEAEASPPQPASITYQKIMQRAFQRL